MPKDLAHEAVTRWTQEGHAESYTGAALGSLEREIRFALALQRVYSYICFNGDHEADSTTDVCRVCESPMRR